MSPRVASTVTLILLTACAVSWAQSEKGLVGRWDLDEGEGLVARDKGRSRSTGRIHGAKWVKQGKGHALEFDGEDDYVDCGARKRLDLTRALTVSAWVFPTATPSGETAICGKSQATYALTHYRNGHAYFYISAGSNGVHAPIEAAAWQHVAGAFDGATLKLYVNGAPAASHASNVQTVSSGERFTIGRIRSIKEYGDVAPFRGRIGAVRLYNRALTAEEVAMQYQGELSLIHI